MTVEIRVAGAWREVDEPTFYPTGDDPREVQAVQIRVDGVWRTAWTRQPAAVGNLTKTGDSWSSVSFSWSAVPTATSYEVYRNGGLLTTVSATSFNSTGLAAQTNYDFKVRAKNSYGYTGEFSPTYRFYTGQVEVRDIGSKAVRLAAINSNSYRRDVGWGYVGTDVRQGYYSSPYGGEGYHGVIDYGATGVRDAIRAQCGGGTTGTNRQLNGVCTSALVLLYRETGVGHWGSARYVVFYTTASAPSGGEPTMVGTGVARTTTLGGQAKWYEIGAAHGQRLGDATNRSIAIFRDTSSDYMSFSGYNVSGDHCDLSITWSWNYVTTAQQNRTWTQL